MKKHGACRIILLCDREHRPLDEPIEFESHVEAQKYLRRSQTFVYNMVRNGEALAIDVSNCFIYPWVQKIGRESINHNVSVHQGLMDSVGGRAHMRSMSLSVRNRKGPTKETHKKIEEAHKKRVCDSVTGLVADSQNELALLLGVTKSMISYWKKTGRVKEV